MKSHSPFYPSKVMLLGEYSVLTGSEGLAVPVDRYGGYWCETEDGASMQAMSDWLDHLTELAGRGIMQLNLEALRADIAGEVRFCSSIPRGCGLGSSGALTAAVLERYGKVPADLIESRRILAAMESFFHGKSSGLDPLVSLYKRPVLTGRHLQLVDPNIWLQFASADRIFLWDCGRERNTKPLVQYFMRSMEDAAFSSAVHSILMPAVDSGIQGILKNEPDIFERSWRVISEFQLKHLSKMIPSSMMDNWREGLRKDHYFFKLCGAGGGGLFLVYVPQGTSLSGAQSAGFMPLLAPSD